MNSYILSFDIGGTNIRYALIDNYNNLHNYSKIKYNKDTNVKQFILDNIYSILKKNTDKNVTKICISSGGIIYDNTIMQSKNIENYENNRFQNSININSLNIPLFIQNDVACTMLYYIYCENIIKIRSNSMTLSFGTGIGSCIIIQGKLIQNSEVDNLEKEYMKYKNISNSIEEQQYFCDILVKYLINYIKLLDLKTIILFTTVIYKPLINMDINKLVSDKLNNYNKCSIYIKNDKYTNLLGSTYITR